MAEDKEEQTLEELFVGLDSIVEKLEEGEVSLEESFRLYQKGMETVSYTHLDVYKRQL